MDLNKFFESLTNGARWDVGVSINRSNALPLDANSVFSSLEAAEAYVNGTAEGVLANAYPGQVLAVVTEEETIIYYVDANKALQPVGNTKDIMAYIGNIPEDSDAETIIEYINAKTAGIASDAALKELQGDVESLEGRADALESIVGKAAEGEAEATGLVKAVADNATAISAEASARETAISGEAIARSEAIKAVTDSIGTVAEGKTVVKMIEDAEAAAKAAIPTAISAFSNDAGYQNASEVSNAITTTIADKADKATTLAGYGITDAYTKDQVTDVISNITHFTSKVVTATTEMTETNVLYLIKSKDVDGKDNYDEYLLIEGIPTRIGDTSTDLTDYVTDNALATELAKYTTTAGLATVLAPYAKTLDVESMLSAKVDKDTYADDKETFALKADVETSLAGKVDNATLDSYYTKTAADALLAEKADAEDTTAALATKVETASITHTSKGVSEGVTKEGTNLKIVVDAYNKEQVYTKSETDAAITAKINSVTGGESAADVKLALEDYRDSLNAEVWGETARSWTKRTTGEDGKVTVTYTPQYGTTSRVDTLETDVATLKTNVQTAQTTADNAATAVTTLENGQVKTNKENIATLTTIINGANAEDNNGLSYRVGALESANTTHATEYATLKAKVNTAVDTTIPAVTARVVANEGAITTINATLTTHSKDIAKKANAADVYTKDEVDGTVNTINENIDKKADAATIYTKTEVDNLLANLDQTELENGIAANAADIAVLVGNDKGENGRANKSIRAIAADEINTLIKAADPAGGKTIENITNLITYVDENAGEIAELVTATSANTAKLADITGTVGATIDSKIEAAKYVLEVATAEKIGGVKSATGDNKVSVAESGVMSVAAVNVNTLTQTAGDVLILNGGSAFD